MKILITGSCGFIGFHLSFFLLKKNFKVIGLDNLNSYYSPKLKKDRLNQLKKFKNFNFLKIDICDESKVKNVFSKNNIDYVFHLAAQAGVRHSIKFPREYIDSNIDGFYNILESCKKYNIKRFFFASSSSVYGETNTFPLKESFNLEPTNTYSLSKKFNEDLAEIFSKYYSTKCTGLRFFTIYGHWGRPDMFINKLIYCGIKNKEFILNNFGNHYRDFTHIDDVINILAKMMKLKNRPNFEIFNICSSSPLKLTDVIKLTKKKIKKIKIRNTSLQAADVIKTHGCNKKLKKTLKFKKFSSFKDGLDKVINWSKSYY